MILKALSYHPLARLLNLAKVTFAYSLSAICGRSIQMGLPFSASIEPANYCNLKCRQCPTGLGEIKKAKSKLSTENFKQTLDAMLPELIYLNLYFQGEPLLNPLVPEMVAYATKHGVTTCISTNGHFLTEDTALKLKDAGLDRLIVSLDGADSKSYSLYRQGGDFETVIQGIKNAVRAGLYVELQCLLLSSTENDKEKIIQIGNSLNVSKITFKTAQFYNSDPLMPTDNRNSRYKKGTLTPKKPQNNRCWRIASSVVINTDGEVLPCCYDKDASHSYGNILQQGAKKDTLCKIIGSQRASDFRNMVFRSRKSISICSNCTE